MRMKRLGSIGLGSIVAISLSWASVASAEDAATEEAAEAAPAAEAPAEEGEEQVEELYVTGSRIKRKDLSTPAPLQVISREELDASGLTSVGDILQRLPSQSNATNTKVNNGGDGSTRVNLRGLGSSRTLILVNGRRFVPGGLGADSSVDMNVIPMSIIDRIEVLKDGASAVYGSDAIGGVVNIITKEDIEGITADAYAGATQDGKGITMDVNVTGGTTFDGGSVWVSAGYYSQGSLMAGDRDFSKYDREYAFGTFDELGITSDEERVYIGGSSAPPWGWYNLDYDPENPGSADMQAIWETYRDADGNIPEGTSTVVTVGEDGQLKEFDFGGSRDAPGTDLLPKGDRFNYQPDNYMLTPSDRIYAFSAGNFDITDDTKAFFEASYTLRTGGQKLAPTPLFAAFDLDNGAIPADQPFNILGADVWDYRHRMVELGTRDYENTVSTMRFVAGIEGVLGDGLSVLSGWDWGVSANYGRTDGATKLLGNLYKDRTQYALRGCVDPEAGADCVPYNPFPYIDANTYYYDLPENADELARLREYLLFEGEDKGYTTQLVGLAEMGGELFDLDGGAAQMAIGAQYRAESGGYTPDPIVAEGNTTSPQSDPTEGDFNVMEAYTEISLPVIDMLDVDGAVRFGQYSSFGATTTFKGGTRITPVDGVTLRATYSTGYRAPSIGALYAGNYEGYPAVADPCSGNVADLQACQDAGLADDFEDERDQLKAIGGGNPDLDAEKAKILTGGMVLEPMDGMSLTVDYYAVEITDPVTSKGTSAILESCYQNGNAEDCAKITRDADSGFIESIDDRLTNLGKTTTAGFDISAKYANSTSMGDYGMYADLNMLQHFDNWVYDGEAVGGLKRISGKDNYDLGLLPTMRANAGMSWNNDGFGLAVNYRFIGGVTECGDTTGNTPCYQKNADGDEYLTAEGYNRAVDAYHVVDLATSYGFDAGFGATNIKLGVNNLMDAAPPTIYSGFYADSDPDYDFMGRYVYVRLIQSL